MKKTSFYILIPTILTAFFAFFGVSFASIQGTLSITDTTFVLDTSSYTGFTHWTSGSYGNISINVYYGDYPSTDTLVNNIVGSRWIDLIYGTDSPNITGARGYLNPSSNGNYYARFVDSSGGDVYTPFTYNNGSYTPILPEPPNSNTRIISVEPENNVNIIPFTQSSTTKYAPFDIDLLEYYNNTSTSTIEYITTILTNKNIPSFTYTKVLFDVATGTATTSYTIYNEVPFGIYDYTIRLFDSNLDLIDATTTTNIQFGSTTLPSITFQDIYGATSTQVYTQVEQSVLSYYNLINLLKTKAPFGYFYVIKDSLSNINTGATSTVNIIIPTHLKTYFFSPFDLAFSGVLWFYFVVFFYKRLKHLTI